MNGSRIVALLLSCVLLAAMPALGEDYPGVWVTKLLTSTVTANGKKIAYLRTDRPEVTALIVEIPPGGETGWHLHQVPVYAYMLAGTITVDLGDGTSRDYREGDAILEVRDTPHNGRNRERVPARLVAFYTGEEGKPNVVRLERPAQPAR